jgi:HEAT repeat protein
MHKIPDLKSLPYILQFFNSESADLREAVIRTLPYLNQVKTCPQALPLMSDSDTSVCRVIALTLGHLQEPEITFILAESLTKDDDWQVRLSAATSVVISENYQAIGEEHWQVRKVAAQAW